MKNLGELAKRMKKVEFKKEFADFFMQYFDDLIEKESDSPDFIAKCYNEFEEVQKTNTSDRGSQRQLKPTIELDRHNLIVEFVKEGLGIGFATKQYIQIYYCTKFRFYQVKYFFYNIKSVQTGKTAI